MGQRAAVYCRVSTGDQSCERQALDLAAFVERGHYDVVSVFRETKSGHRIDRLERAKVIALARDRQIEVILVTELKLVRPLRRVTFRSSPLLGLGRAKGKPHGYR